MRYIQLLAVSVCLYVPVVVRAEPTTTSPGKSSVFAEEHSGMLDSVGNITPLAGQIAKGKRKTVVRIDATVGINGNPAVTGVLVLASVNGHFAQPGFAYANQCSTASAVQCSATGTFWLDIDAAETAFPGVYVGQPLDIQVVGGNQAVAGMGLSYHVSFSAQVVKK